ncbi:MAG TPA: hypothetical protein PLP23_05160 [Panacibacter sp.]|nr:hypothetical protein [Panacibacter sp.]
MQTLYRQITHWHTAAKRMANVEQMASGTAWQGLQQSTGALIKLFLQKCTAHLAARGQQLKQQLQTANSAALRLQLRRALLKYKADYLRSETTIHFYTDAINTRTQTDVAAMLKGCDVLCNVCMQTFLEPLHKTAPPVITYLDKGLGAAIMKAGLRLWDGSISPVALIKITYHNLVRPTAVLHECGHQVAHILNWNMELALLLLQLLKDKDAQVAKAFAGWSSEIAADTVALVTSGYGAVAALHDVVDGDADMVFNYEASDPHPISYLRVLLNCAMCTVLFGAGAWNNLEKEWIENHPLAEADKEAAAIIKKSIPLLPLIAQAILQTKQKAFNNKSITELVNANLVLPAALKKFEDEMQRRANHPNEYLTANSLKIVALSGYKVATEKNNIEAATENLSQFLKQLGGKAQLQYSLN